MAQQFTLHNHQNAASNIILQQLQGMHKADQHPHGPPSGLLTAASRGLEKLLVIQTKHKLIKYRSCYMPYIPEVPHHQLPILSHPLGVTD